MNILNNKLNRLATKINSNKTITIMIVGLGSVGGYLLNYLVSLSNPKIKIVVVGRDKSKMEQDVNVIKISSTIRKELSSSIEIKLCDLNDVNAIQNLITQTKTDFLINASRVYSGLKYGSISWKNFRAYGIWSPLSVAYIKNIMQALEKVNYAPIVINTSFSDVVNPWIKSQGLLCPDFGSGNLNHLVPRIKFAIAEKFNIKNYNDIDITIATSHFHNVIISKEGHDEGIDMLFSVKYKGEELKFDKSEIYKQCTLNMPSDYRRNMMSASSTFEIIKSILEAIENNTKRKFHAPGFGGELGGYPVMIDAKNKNVTINYFTEVFSLEKMITANEKSIYLDGIEKIENGTLYYTNELIEKVKKSFDIDLPKTVPFEKIETIIHLIKTKIIGRSLQK